MVKNWCIKVQGLKDLALVFAIKNALLNQQFFNNYFARNHPCRRDKPPQYHQQL